MNYEIGYCTNVHAGRDLATTRANLRQHAVAVKEAFRPAGTLGIGLWLSAAAAGQLRQQNQTAPFAEWLAEQGLVPFTLNGFPYGDFHQPVVKHEVYKPTWRQPARLAYTLDLIEILHQLLPAGMEGSISTLPLEWGSPRVPAEKLAASAEALRRVAERLRHLEDQSGRLISLCLEPEPGCALDTSRDVVHFFEQHLCRGGDETAVRRYVRVCHDICHAAVMFEDQADVLQTYQRAGIAVGKVQVSSAVMVPWDRIDSADRGAAIEQLASFAEDRYLHQTTVRPPAVQSPIFFQDLPDALAAVENAAELEGQWRIHFHVPIYLERFGHLQASRDDILQGLQAAQQYSDVRHFEVETYAWGVLPAELQQPTLAGGIADELKWFAEQMPPDRNAGG